MSDIIKSICVYCGSSSGTNPAYSSAAEQLARLLCEENIQLVYGAGSVGLMGILADTVLKNGGKVTGVIPTNFTADVTHQALTRLEVVDSMHQRKAMMFELTDALIALPGGIGTLEELSEVLTWAQLGLHEKPLGVLNTEGYYDKLRDLLDHMVEEGFFKSTHRSLLIFENDPKALLDRLRQKAASAGPAGNITQKDITAIE